MGIPVVCLLAIGGYRPVAIIVAGVPALFVLGATAWEIYRAFWWPATVVIPPPPPQLGPEGVLSQDEAEKRLADLIAEFSERDGGGT